MPGRPTYYLQARIKGDPEAYPKRVGAAWEGTSSSGVPYLRVVLDTATTLRWDDGLELTLWPARNKKEDL